MFMRSIADVRKTGYRALIESLGFTDAIRFFIQVSQRQGDYGELQERIFGEMSVDELNEQAEAHWKQRR